METTGTKVLHDLVTKSDGVIESLGGSGPGWRVHLYGFSRAGWSASAKSFAREFNHSSGTGGGIELLDLAAIDQALVSWAGADF